MRRIVLLILVLFTFTGFAGNPHKASSVLSSGHWWKMGIAKTGIYRITYQDLVDMEMNPASVDPSTIRIFGNGGKMLPESNESARPDDLREIAIEVVDGGDGKFDPQDYILFYGTGTEGWDYNYQNGLFHHFTNLYSDLSFYFITSGGETGKRILGQASLDTVPDYLSNSFTDHVFHETDSLNLIKSGKLWVGELFDANKTACSFPLSFPEINPAFPIRIETSVVSRSSKPSRFFVFANDVPVDTILVEYTDPNSINIFARPKTSGAIVPMADSLANFRITYDLPNNNSQGWLDYIEITCQRFLSFRGSQMPFRDPGSIGKDRITRFSLSGIQPSVKIWNITNETDVREIIPELSGELLSFVLKTDSLKEFVAFDGTGFDSVQLIGKVENQNLHSALPAKMITIAAPMFLNEAKRLAAFHDSDNGLSTLVVNVEEIYNEFSSGKKDISAIRDFVKMLYDLGSTADQPKYLLLFGDGSYDPKNRIPGNNDLIPVFESAESLKPVGTYVSDDFFGIMGEKEGYESNGSIEVGTGRFPVSSMDEAKTMVDKIIHYSGNSDSICSPWKNTFTFIADDENNNLHFHQAEQLVKIVNDHYPVYNVNKIYLDAYKMVSTPAGDRLPDVNAAINKAMKDGTLILNYTGHGGEDGWSAEKVLTIADISNWDNYNKLPVFITATCEFSRFDNPERLTAGEMVLLQPKGGAIALYSTTRQALATANFKLDTSFFQNLIPGNGLPNPRMGDLIRISKNRNGNNYSIRNFVLLGDPAQGIAFPENNMTATLINGDSIVSVHDTAMGLSRVTVKGEVRGLTGVKMSGFSGEMFISVFDKPTYHMTIGNTPNSYPEQFRSQTSLLHSGTATVKEGDFECTFVVPMSVTSSLGEAKMSFYSRNGTTDANGYSSQLVVGGKDPSINPVNAGPQIDLYMDSYSFKNGEKTGKNPIMMANLNDPDGINFINLGIGHEISAEMDGDAAALMILNDFYQPEPDQYSSGSVKYALTDLSSGKHTLKVRAWDLYNNSSVKEITFFVTGTPGLSISPVYNFPNPMQDHTKFSFTPGKKFRQLYIQIRIYNFAGQIVKILSKTFDEETIAPLEMEWDGTGENHNLLAPGLYIYQLVAKSDDGSVTKVNQKLVITGK